MRTCEALDAFEKLVLKEFIQSRGTNGWTGLGIYKTQELYNFVSFLFYLFEDDEIREIIAFTQTLRWIKQLASDCARLHHGHFIFEQSTDQPQTIPP